AERWLCDAEGEALGGTARTTTDVAVAPWILIFRSLGQSGAPLRRRGRAAGYLDGRSSSPARAERRRSLSARRRDIDRSMVVPISLRQPASRNQEAIAEITPAIMMRRNQTV